MVQSSPTYYCHWCEAGSTTQPIEHKIGCERPKVGLDKNGEPDSWTIKLNKYQRDNLVWLLTVVGGFKDIVEPFNMANTGDWVAEVTYLLDKPKGSPDDRPNKTIDDLKQDVQRWLVYAKTHLT